MHSVIVDAAAARRVQRGHAWIFSNQVLRVEGSPEPGDVVLVSVAGGDRKPVGSAFYHPRSLIALRMVSAEGGYPDRAWLSTRLLAAEAFRRRAYPGADSWRTCHGEADGLPGLFIDRYADAFVVQVTCAGMERLLPSIASALVEELGARSVVERNESHLRDLEGLPQRSGLLAGEEPGRVIASMPPLRLRVDPSGGQKTGAFLDQRENRVAAARWAAGCSVYEAHCNVGGFGIMAALAGATSVVGVDSSAEAVAAAEANAALNGVEGRCRWVVADAEEDMDARHRRRERFGVVMIDPPSFTRSRKHVPQARRALKDLNRRAMTLVEPGGILVSSDCSHHVFEDAFLDDVGEAAWRAGRRLSLLEIRSQSPDHVVLAAMPETRYLKCVIARLD